jgi:hypothetical protein
MDSEACTERDWRESGWGSKVKDGERRIEGRRKSFNWRCGVRCLVDDGDWHGVRIYLHVLLYVYQFSVRRNEDSLYKTTLEPPTCTP